MHSVFKTALNLQTERGLLTLLSGGRGLSPGGMLLRQRVDFTTFGLSLGGAVLWGADYLWLPEHSQRVCMAGAQAVDLTMPTAIAFRPAAPAQGRAVLMAGEIPAREEAGQGLAPLLCLIWHACPYQMPQNHFTRHLLPGVRLLIECLGRSEIQPLEELAGSLAGCGVGLTPSSDDFLCGLMAALYAQAAAGILTEEYAVKAAQALARGACPKTGEISAAFLRHAASGRFDESILALAAAFFSFATLPVLRQATKKLIAHGSSSGCDILTGFCFGLLPQINEKP